MIFRFTIFVIPMSHVKGPIMRGNLSLRIKGFCPRKWIAKLKIDRQSSQNRSLRNSIFLYGTTVTEILFSDLFYNKSLLKYVALPQGFKIYILQRNIKLCMPNFFTKKVWRTKLCRQTTQRLFPQFGDSLSPPPGRHIPTIRHLFLLKGTKRQQSGQMIKIFKTKKAIEIQQARPTEVRDKVLSENKWLKVC